MTHHHCHGEQCHTGHHHQGSSGYQSKHGHSCCCCCSCCCCSHHHESHHHDEHGSFAEELLEMADDAWMEVLREKIKEQIMSTSGEHLDRLAKLVSDSNHERWKNKMGAHRSSSDFKDKIREFFFHSNG